MKKTIFLSLFFLPLTLAAQTGVTYFLDTVAGCPGSAIDVEVKVKNFVYISSIGGNIEYESNCLEYTGYSVNPLLPWPFIAYAFADTGGKSNLLFAAFDMMGGTALPDSAVLCTLTFNYLGYATDLHWDTTGTTGISTYIDGYVACGITGFAFQPAGQQAAPGDTFVFAIQALNPLTTQYQWQESPDGGISWTDLTDTPPCSGTATASLTISGVTPQLDQYRYRCVNTGCDTAISQDATLSVNVPPSLLANIHYQNTGQYPLQNATIVLFNNWIPVYTVYSGLTGDFSITNIQPGVYTMAIYCQEPWGGANALDGLMILQHFTGMITLSGLAAKAADLNADGAVNSLDALMVLQRFVGTISAFPGGDWQFEPEFLTIPASVPVTLSINALCTGDVNGSHLP